MKKDLQVGDEVVAICMGSVLKRFVVDSISCMGDVRYKDNEGNPSTLLTNHWIKNNGQVGVIYPHKNISHINCVEYYYVTDEMKERYENISLVQNLKTEMIDLMHCLSVSQDLSDNKKHLEDLNKHIVFVKSKIRI